MPARHEVKFTKERKSMSLISLAYKNIVRNIYSYLLYSVTIIMGVMVYYTFSSLPLNISSTADNDIASFLEAFFPLGNEFIMIAIVIFVWYCNSYFIKQRREELSLYLVLGIKRFSISIMLLIETVIIGVVSIASGIFLGSLFLKFFSMILFRLMAHPVSSVIVDISPKVMGDTFRRFIMLFIILGIRNFFVIRKVKLIDMMRDDTFKDRTLLGLYFFIAYALLEHSFTLSFDNFLLLSLSILMPITFIVLGWKFFMLIFKIPYRLLGLHKFKLIERFKQRNSYFISSIIIIYLIYRAYLLFSTTESAPSGFIIAVLIIIGATYGFFATVLVTLVYISKKSKTLYYKSLNLINISRLHYRVKENSIALATISLLITATVFVGGIAYGFYYELRFNYSNDNLYGLSYVIEGPKDESIDSMISENCGEDLDKIIEFQFLKVPYSTPENKYVISESTFKKAMATLGKDTSLSLRDNEAFFLYGNMPMVNMNLNSDFTIPKFNKTFTFIGKDKLLLSNSLTLESLICVSDKTYADLIPIGKPLTNVAYLINNSFKYSNLYGDVSSFINTHNKDTIIYQKVNFSSLDNKSNTEMAGSGIFAGSFMALVLMLCTATTIFFKQLRDASSERQSYKLLSNLGVTEHDIKKSLKIQVFLFFMFPLGVGIFNASLAFTSISFMLPPNIDKLFYITIFTFIAIYYVYYKITVEIYFKTLTK